MKARVILPMSGLLLALLTSGCAQPVKPTQAAPAVKRDGAVHEYRLDNGLKLIVKEDRRAPVMVSQVWYKVGASYEHNGSTGLSHVLEHMMFKGTHKHGPNEFSRIIAANGGRENAFTGDDYTAYFQSMEASRVEVAFELEADRMRNLLLPPEEFKKELQVVIEERRMRTEDDPRALASELFQAAAYTSSPYRNPVIGWMNDLEHMKVEDLRAWYQKWYAPNNATVVVVGDVDPEHVYRLAQKYFGPLKPSELGTLKPQKEPAPRGQRRIAVKAPAELPYLLMGYHTPVVKTAPESWEPYALDVLAGILDGGDSARFARELVRGKQIASGVGAGYNGYARDDQLFTFSGTPAEGHSVAELEQAIREQITRVQNELASEQELARVKAQVVAGKVYERDSGFYQAMTIGMLETVGLSWRLMDDYVDRVRAVTPEQIRAVARKYLVDDRLTVAVLDPQPLDQAAKPRMPKAGASHAH